MSLHEFNFDDLLIKYFSLLFLTVEEVDIGIKFTNSEIHFLSGDSIEYKFRHKYEVHRIDRLLIGGDLDHIEEISLKYGKK